MKTLSLLFAALLVLGAVGQDTTYTTLFETSQPAGNYAAFYEFPVPATDASGLEINVLVGNETSVSVGLSLNAPCLFDFGGVPYLGGCLAEANGTAMLNSTAFIPAGFAFLSVLNPAGAEYSVTVTAEVCDTVGAVGPLCASPVSPGASATIGIGPGITYLQLPLLTASLGSIATIEFTASSESNFNYTELVFGSLPLEANNTDSSVDITISQPFIALDNVPIPSGEYYYIGFSAEEDATISYNITRTNCTSGYYNVITEDDDEECLFVPTLNTNSAAVIDLNDNFFDSNDWAYFKLNTTFFGSTSSLTVGALPLSSDQLPVLYLRCGNLPTEEAYDIMIETPEPDNSTALFYSGDLSDTCTWFIGFLATDSDQKDGFELWLNSLCPHDCTGYGDCINNLCVCDESWTGTDCSSAVAPGASPDDATESPRFWDIDEWSPAAWVAVVLLVILIIAVIALSVALGVMSKKWNDARRGSYDKL